MTHQEYRERRDEIQRQCWQASIVNRDNPLSHNLLDAHFAAIDRLFLDAVGDEYHVNVCANDMLHKETKCWCGTDNRNQLRQQLRTTITPKEGGDEQTS